MSDRSCQRSILIGFVVGDLFYDADLFRESDDGVLVAEFDFEDGFIIPEGINVDLKVLILIDQAVTVLPDLPPGQKTLSFSSCSRNWHF